MQLLPAFQGSASAPFLRNGSAALPIGRRLFGKKAFSQITSDSLTWKSDVAQDNKAQYNHNHKEHKAKYHAEQMLSLPGLWKGFRASLYITDEFYYCNYKKNDWGSKNHAPQKNKYWNQRHILRLGVFNLFAKAAGQALLKEYQNIFCKTFIYGIAVTVDCSHIVQC